jgi:hypothetical protein
MIKLITFVITITGFFIFFYKTDNYQNCREIKKEIQQLYFTKSNDNIGSDRKNLYGIYDERIFVRNNEYRFSIVTDDKIFSGKRDAIAEIKATSNLAGVVPKEIQNDLTPGSPVYFSSDIIIKIPDSAYYNDKDLIITLDVKYAKVDLTESKSKSSGRTTFITNYYNLLSTYNETNEVYGKIIKKEQVDRLMGQLTDATKKLRNVFLLCFLIVSFILLIIGIFADENILEFTMINLGIFNVILFFYLMSFNLGFFSTLLIQLGVAILGFWLISFIQYLIGKLLLKIFPDMYINYNNFLFEP